MAPACAGRRAAALAAALPQGRRADETAGEMADDPGSWDQHFARLKAQGMDGPAIAAALPQIRVEPVLTAHPTEVRRKSMIDHRNRIAELMGLRDAGAETTPEGDRIGIMRHQPHLPCRQPP